MGFETHNTGRTYMGTTQMIYSPSEESYIGLGELSSVWTQPRVEIELIKRINYPTEVWNI